MNKRIVLLGLQLLIAQSAFAAIRCRDYLTQELPKLPKTEFSHGRFVMQELIRGVFYLTFQEQVEQNSTFVRAQEFYESPEFAGKVFTLKQFIPWYVRSRLQPEGREPQNRKENHFTYYSDWTGFNLPSWVLQNFYEGKFDPLRHREKDLLGALRDYHNRGQKYYVISTYILNRSTDRGTAESTIQHELAHALFYFDADYKREVLAVLETFDKTPIINFLSTVGGYNESVYLDEVNANVVLAPGGLMRMEAKGYLKAADYVEVGKILDEIFQRYFQIWKAKPLLSAEGQE